MFDRLPIATKIQLLAVDNLFGRSHRSDEDAAFHCRLQKFSFGLGSKELREDVFDSLILLGWFSAIEEHHRVFDPIFISGRFVTKTLLPHPCH